MNFSRAIAAILCVFCMAIVAFAQTPDPCPNCPPKNTSAISVCQEGLGESLYDLSLTVTNDLLKEMDQVANEVVKIGSGLIKAGVDIEVLKDLNEKFKHAGYMNNLGRQYIRHSEMLAEIAEGDSDYLDATKDVLMAYRYITIGHKEVLEVREALNAFDPPESPEVVPDGQK